MKNLKAKFCGGVSGNNYKEKSNLPQVAFFGRSNSGKSSTINSLVGEKKLVRVSKTPGETKEANFYLVNDSFYLVDFPGYGYAKCSMKFRNKMIKRILWYIRESEVKPRAVFITTDAKVGLTDLDREMIDELIDNNHKFVIIVNKIDKIGKLKQKERKEEIGKEYEDALVILFSAKTKENIDTLKSVVLDFVK